MPTNNTSIDISETGNAFSGNSKGSSLHELSERANKNGIELRRQSPYRHANDEVHDDDIAGKEPRHFNPIIPPLAIDSKNNGINDVNNEVKHSHDFDLNFSGMGHGRNGQPFEGEFKDLSLYDDDDDDLSSIDVDVRITTSSPVPKV
jgi:hypothetical protein